MKEQEKHYILYPHAGSANHGCEAIVRTTVDLINSINSKSTYTLLSYDITSDRKYGLDSFCNLCGVYEKRTVKRKSYRWLSSAVKSKLRGDKTYLSDLQRMNAISAKKGDIALSIGGDNYCYRGFEKELIELNAFFRRNGIKTVLWGASVDSDALSNPCVVKDMQMFDLITARETKTYKALKSINKNTVLVSDSAFTLKASDIQLPIGFCKDNTIGLNFSLMSENEEKIKGISRKNYENLIEFILNKTAYKILLIPHVVVNEYDDRLINKYLFEKFKDSGRIYSVEDNDCKTLKGYISNCSFFIGARTHATIAAYSSLVPTLTLGYSMKSKGIAEDIFGDDRRYVISVQDLKTESDLTNAFIWMIEHEEIIQKKLGEVIPAYIERAIKGVEILNRL